MELRYNTATTRWIGPFISTDGVTNSTGLTITWYIAKNAGNFAATTGTNSESTQVRAFYKCPLTATNLGTYGDLMLVAQSSSDFLTVWKGIQVVNQNYWDTKYGTDEFQVDVVQVIGSTSGADDLEGLVDDIAGLNDAVDTSTDVNDILTNIAALNDAVDVSTDVNDILTNIGALNDISSTDVLTQTNAALVAQDLDHIAKVDYAGGGPTSGTLFDLILNKSTDQTFSQANDSLEAIRDRGDTNWITGGAGGLTTTDVYTQSQAAIDASTMIYQIVDDTSEIQGKLPTSDIGGSTELDDIASDISGLNDAVDVSTDVNDILTNIAALNDAVDVSTDVNDVLTNIGALNDISSTDVLTQVNASTEIADINSAISGLNDAVDTSTDVNDILTNIGALNDVSTTDILTQSQAGVDASTEIDDIASSISGLNDVGTTDIYTQAAAVRAVAITEPTDYASMTKSADNLLWASVGRFYNKNIQGTSDQLTYTSTGGVFATRDISSSTSEQILNKAT